MNKKNSIWLLVAVWTLVSCGTVKSTREKPAVALAQSSLTPEQQRKYDYFFLEAMRLKEKKDMRPLSDYCSIVWIFIRIRLLRFMRFRSIICSFVRCRKGKKRWKRLWRMRRITTGIVRDWHLCISSRTNWIRLSPCWNRWWYVSCQAGPAFQPFGPVWPTRKV